MSLGRRLVACALACALALPIAGCGGEPVPDITGRRVWFAKPTLERYGFLVGRVRYDEHAPAPVGTVIEQDPGPGDHARPGSAVDVVIAGPELIRVPRLVGLTRHEAIDALEQIGLRHGPVVELHHELFAAGTVIEQGVAIGTLAEGDARIGLTVSLGPETVPLPGVIGRDLGQARGFLRDLGMHVTVRREPSPNPAGIVLRQDPGVRRRVEPGTEVALVVSDGPDEHGVPEVTGMTVREAEEALRKAGFRASYPGVDRAATVDPQARVSEQEPESGATLPAGLPVVLRLEGPDSSDL